VGGAFSHSTVYCIISMTIRAGIRLKVRVLFIALIRSFITLIWRSISGTCSLAAVVFRFIYGISSLRHSNPLSMREVSTLKPRLWYRRNIFFKT
jgi:hypothetical protein